MSYTVVGLLGRGGMAVVELAVDDEGRQVARKRVSLRGSAQQIATARHRIRREAEILASLHHPGIVPLLEVDDDGTDVVLVMPRMAGSLADRVERAGPLTPDQVTALAGVLLDALATAHRQGIVHRDIKPANVLFSPTGRPALADFGVAVNRHFTPGLTMAGTIVGTPEFIAPEQAAGQAATAASDVFSLGATLLYALTGQGPYGQGEPLVLLNRAAHGHIEPVPASLPSGFRRALSALLDPRPERRPSAAAALGGPAGTQVDLPRPPPPPSSGKGKGVALVGAVVLAFVAAAVAAATTFYHPGRHGSSPHRLADPIVTTPAPTTTPTTACVPAPYEPCGQAPAPGTNGVACLAGRADLDGDPANGCEAVSDYQAGQILQTGQPVHANIIPASSVDVYQAQVNENLLSFCLTKYRVVLIAPQGSTDEVQILQNGRVLAHATSSNLHPATATASKPSCFDSGSANVIVQVSQMAGQTADDFTLISSGSW